MISGVIAQGTTVPRGMVAPATYFDDGETVVAPFIDLAATITRLLIPGVTSDSDTIFAARRLLSLTAAFVTADDNVRAPRLVAAQVLRPELYVAVDVFPLPTVALPGILQTHFHSADDAFFSPFIEAHGSLRPGLFNAFDAIYAPTIAGARTLLPNLHTSTDTFYTPAVRARLAPALVTDSDVFFVFSTGKLFPGLVTDSDTFAIPVVASPFATFDAAPSNVTLSGGNLIATHSNTSLGGARSAKNRLTGQCYFEVTVGATHGANDCIGIITASGTYSDPPSNVTIVYCNSGSGGIWYYSSNTGKNLGGNLVAGDVVGIAVDVPNFKTWIRKNGGNWNGDPTANPATGTGSVGAAVNCAPFVGFGGTGTASGDNFTANFGQSTFANPAPSGYNNW